MKCGTRWSFLNGCHCDACRVANKVYEQRYRRGVRIRPRSDTFTAEEVRTHLRWLREQGVRWATIETLTGVTHTTLWRIANGRAVPTVATAKAILGIGLHRCVA